MRLKCLKVTLLGMLFSTFSIANIVKAGVIDDSPVLLDNIGITQIENWLGEGDFYWDGTWYVSHRATEFALDVKSNNVGSSVSIYNVSYDQVDAKFDTYYALDFSAVANKQITADRFVYELTPDIAFDFTSKYKAWEIYSRSDHFAAFEGGNDLYKDDNYVGRDKGYSYDYSYTNGSINAVQLLGVPYNGPNLKINALEKFTYQRATKRYVRSSRLKQSQKADKKTTVKLAPENKLKVEVELSTATEAE